MRSKILLIVEGEKEEPRILGSNSHGLLSLIGSDYDIVTFSNPIYELYDAYKKGEYDDLVSYLREEKGLEIDKNILSKNAFSSVYLVFDFEPHYHKYKDSKIKDILNVFNNETELGKIYINYPMVESFYYLKNIPDLEYLDRKISLENFNGKDFKKLVNDRTILKKNKLSNKQLCYIIWVNYNKVRKITNNEEIDHELILDEQLKLKKNTNELYILSTFPLLVLDYNYEKTIEVIKERLKSVEVL